MPRLSLALATALIVLALAAQAYSTEPVYTVMQVAMSEAGSPDQTGDVCEQPLVPELVAALALPQIPADVQMPKLACARQ